MSFTPPQRPKDQVEQALKTVDQIHDSGAMPDDVYYKCLVSLAYEYIQADDHQAGLVLISKCPPSYFQDVQPGQMQEDGLYRDVVVLLAYKLIQLGVVTGDVDLYAPTQAGAQA